MFLKAFSFICDTERGTCFSDSDGVNRDLGFTATSFFSVDVFGYFFQCYLYAFIVINMYVTRSKVAPGFMKLVVEAFTQSVLWISRIY